jgi:flagellar biosynthesis protein FlhG
VRLQLQNVVDAYVNKGLDKPVQLELVGELPTDSAVRDAVLQRQLMLERYPGSPAAQAVLALAGRLAR